MTLLINADLSNGTHRNRKEREGHHQRSEIEIEKSWGDDGQRTKLLKKG